MNMMPRWWPWSHARSPLHLHSSAGPCATRDRLRAVASTPHSTAPQRDHTVRLYYWYRFAGARRAARKAQEVACPEHSGLRCVLDSTEAGFATAHAVVVFVGARPERHCLPPKRAGHQWVVEYLESPAYYPELWDAAFMSQFALKVSHEHDSDLLLMPGVHPLVEGGVLPPTRWLRRRAARQRRALVWMAHNCESRNRREQLVRALQRQLPASLPLHSVGRCVHTHDAPTLMPKAGAWAPGGESASLRSKLAVLGGYAFCLVLENSIAADYVSEKLFHAFAAGCLPVYYGTRDVRKLLPHPKAAVQVLNYPSVAALVDALRALAERPEELEARLAWRNDAALVDGWWRGLRNRTAAARTSSKRQHLCSVCQAVRSLHGGNRSLPPSPRPAESAWAPLRRRPRLTPW